MKMKILMLSMLAFMLPCIGLNAQGMPFPGMSQPTAQMGEQPEKPKLGKKGERLKMLMGLLVQNGLDEKQAKEVIEKLVEHKLDRKADHLKEALEEVGVDDDKIEKIVEAFKVMKRAKMQEKLQKALSAKQHQQAGPTEEAGPGGPQQGGGTGHGHSPFSPEMGGGGLMPQGSEGEQE